MRRKTIFGYLLSAVIGIFVAFAIMYWLFHFTFIEAMSASICGMIGGQIAIGLISYGASKKNSTKR